MYFLWRNKPRAVLGLNMKWIAPGDVEKEFNSVMAFPTAESARSLQEKDFAHMGVSVINRKTFQQKTKIKKMPLFHTVAVQSVLDKGNDVKSSSYADYLDYLCVSSIPAESSVVFPPSNLRETFDTPLINRIRKMLTDIQTGTEAMEDERERLLQEIRSIDLLISDRIHQVEMMQLTPEESVYFTSELRKIRIERRKKKNELTAVLLTKDLLQTIERSAVKDTIKEIEKLGKQEHHCRILRENDEIVKRRNGKGKGPQTK